MHERVSFSVVLRSMAESSDPRDGTDLVSVLTDAQQRRAFVGDHSKVTTEDLEMVGQRIDTLLT